MRVRRVLTTCVSSAILLACTLSPSGCGPAGPPVGTVTGKVTCKGIPVTVGMVEIDLPGAGVGAYSLLDEEGRFAIEEFPIRTGVYTVCVRPPSHPDPEHPVFKRKSAVKIPRYAQSMATSGLTITVNPGKNDVVIELKD